MSQYSKIAAFYSSTLNFLSGIKLLSIYLPYYVLINAIYNYVAAAQEVGSYSIDIIDAKLTEWVECFESD